MATVTNEEAASYKEGSTVEATTETTAGEKTAVAQRALIDEAIARLTKVRAGVESKGWPEDMLTLWYPKGEAVVFGVWAADPDEDAYEDGDGKWRQAITGWVLPDSPPWLELVFNVEVYGLALRTHAEVTDRYYAEMLKSAIEKAERAAEFAEMMLERDREQLELEALCNRRLAKQREYNRRKWDPNYRATK